MKKNKNLVELPLEMLSIARSKCESINRTDHEFEESKESKSASNMIGKIHMRATEELKCYVRVAMMRTGFEYNLANDCSPLDKNGIRIRMTRSEFFDTYISIFDMSDGSNIDDLYSDNSTGKMTLKGSSLNYTSSLLRLVGVEELSPAGESDMMTFQVCGIDMVKIFMLGIIGNFVTSTKKGADEASQNGLAKVVIDVYTGRLTLVNSFSVVRSYFLETMLIISILAVAKLTIIRNVKVVVVKASG